MLVARARSGRATTSSSTRRARGVSIAAIQIAKLLRRGACSTTASSDEKLAKAKELGADVLINYAKDDVLAAVRAATGKAGVDVVVDHVGEATFETLAALAEEGRQDRDLRRDVGAEDRGRPAPRLLQEPLDPRIDDGQPRRDAPGVEALRDRASCVPSSTACCRSTRVAEAHQALEERAVFGKVILEVSR